MKNTILTELEKNAIDTIVIFNEKFSKYEYYLIKDLFNNCLDSRNESVLKIILLDILKIQILNNKFDELEIENNSLIIRFDKISYCNYIIKNISQNKYNKHILCNYNQLTECLNEYIHKKDYKNLILMLFNREEYDKTIRNREIVNELSIINKYQDSEYNRLIEAEMEKKRRKEAKEANKYMNCKPLF